MSLDKLRAKLAQKKPRVDLRYAYYDMHHAIDDYSMLMPDGYRWLSSSLGWCATAVDSLADRMVFNRFRRDFFDLNGIYARNNPDIIFDSAVLSALISSCCFVYISPDGDGYPRLQVIDGANATGRIDPITSLLAEGYAVLERDDNGIPTLEAYFEPYKTTYLSRGDKTAHVLRHKAPAPLLVPVIYRPDAKRPFGHSRISRACIDRTQEALRELRRLEVSSEFYSYPQKYVLGLSDEATFDNRRATYSTFLRFGKDEDGDRPVVGQFTAASIAPHVDHLRLLASLFAGDTGLTLADLGFVSDNPTSADAIKASHEKLRLTARKAKATFGTGFLNAGYLAACVRDQYTYKREELTETVPVWRPTFEPDAAMIAAIGDAAYKIEQALPGYFDADTLEDILGIRSAANAD